MPEGGIEMPYVTVKMLAGRTVEQKRALIEKVTAAVSESVDAPKENVTVFIEEMEKTDYGQAGVMFADK
jgi:4-oxalocrotonate tautomerase